MNLVVGLRRVLLPNVGPRHGDLYFVARLKSRKAVLEVLDPIEQLGVPIDVDKDAGEATALRDVERLVGVAQGIELASETSTEVFCSDDSGHG